MKKIYLFQIILLLFSSSGSAQSPISLRPDVLVNYVMDVQLQITRMDIDPISGDLFYATAGGNIYRLMAPLGTPAYDTLVAASNLHGVT